MQQPSASKKPKNSTNPSKLTRTASDSNLYKDNNVLNHFYSFQPADGQKTEKTKKLLQLEKSAAPRKPQAKRSSLITHHEASKIYVTPEFFNSQAKNRKNRIRVEEFQDKKIFEFPNLFAALQNSNRIMESPCKKVKIEEEEEDLDREKEQEEQPEEVQFRDNTAATDLYGNFSQHQHDSSFEITSENPQDSNHSSFNSNESARSSKNAFKNAAKHIMDLSLYHQSHYRHYRKVTQGRRRSLTDPEIILKMREVQRDSYELRVGEDEIEMDIDVDMEEDK